MLEPKQEVHRYQRRSLLHEGWQLRLDGNWQSIVVRTCRRLCGAATDAHLLVLVPRRVQRQRCLLC